MLIVQEGCVAVSCESQFNNYVDRISFQVAKSLLDHRSPVMFCKNIKRLHVMRLLLITLSIERLVSLAGNAYMLSSPIAIHL